MIADKAVEVAGVQTAIYRLYDLDDALLYVGIAKNPEGRFRAHRTEKFWWMAAVRRVLTWYPDRNSASIDEGRAIFREWPLYNISNPLSLNSLAERPAAPPLQVITSEDVLSEDDARWFRAQCERPGMSPRKVVIAAVKHYRRAVETEPETTSPESEER